MPLKPPEPGFEYVHRKEDGDSLCMGVHNFNLILLAPMPAEVQVQQMLCDPRMHWSQAHLWSLSLATCLAWIKSITFHNCGQNLSCSEFIFWVDILPTMSVHMNHEPIQKKSPSGINIFLTLLLLLLVVFTKRTPTNFVVILIHLAQKPFWASNRCSIGARNTDFFLFEDIPKN